MYEIDLVYFVIYQIVSCITHDPPYPDAESRKCTKYGIIRQRLFKSEIIQDLSKMKCGIMYTPDFEISLLKLGFFSIRYIGQNNWWF